MICLLMSFVYHPSALGNRSYHLANIYFTNWVKQDGETEAFCALVGVNYQIMWERLLICLPYLNACSKIGRQ